MKWIEIDGKILQWTKYINNEWKRPKQKSAQIPTEYGRATQRDSKQKLAYYGLEIVLAPVKYFGEKDIIHPRCDCAFRLTEFSWMRVFEVFILLFIRFLSRVCWSARFTAAICSTKIEPKKKRKIKLTKREPDRKPSESGITQSMYYTHIPEFWI